MCGIFGIVTEQTQPLGKILVEAGQRLSYRGYDSIGCATIASDGRGTSGIDLRKDTGKIDEVNSRLNFEEMSGQRGIVQLRWATFGSPSQVNSQPHLDSDGDLVGAHNGNIVNNVSLREAFVKEGMTVRSSNDGESCVHAVERYYDQGRDMVESIRRAARTLQGDYAFVIGHQEGETLHAIKQGSGLVVGIGEGATCVSSDLPSILPLTNKILRMYDGEIVTLWHDRVELRRVDDGTLIEREPEIFTEGMGVAEKGGYPHFMLKEIHEQPQVAAELIHWLDASPHVAPFLEALTSARRLYLVGCGTSYHACLVGAAYLSRLAGLGAVPVLAPQFTETMAHTLGPEDTIVFVSQSGETKDVLNALKAARRSEARILGVLNVIGATLMLASDHYLPLACGYEISVPATKTYLNQVVLFLYLADRLGRPGARIDWAQVPNLIAETLELTNEPARRVAEVLNPFDEMYYLGYGSTLGVALEGALKLKEITYAHCEGMLSSEFKHGPLSAVYDGYPVLFVTAPDDAAMMVNHVNEVACRGGRSIVVAGEDPLLRGNVMGEISESSMGESAHDYLLLPSAGHELTALLAVLPLQLISYHMSVARGIDPDFPRNLSKTLTVD
ncbi:MAG: glutamine--fructose-6-phosphate transaminase (isomerizing) [Anaerolineales bacterium]|nr:glutamine--fructose-6-phosphate transaminase (isomerizing) [Anaerolineales bacterium]